MPLPETKTTEQAEAPVLHRVTVEPIEVIVRMVLHHPPEAIHITEVIRPQEVLPGTVRAEVPEAINLPAELHQGVVVTPDLQVVPEVPALIEVVVAAPEVLEVTEAVAVALEAPEV